MNILLAIGTVVTALILKLVIDWREKKSLQSELPGYAFVTVLCIIGIIWSHNEWVFSLMVISLGLFGNTIFRLFSKTSK